MTRKVTLYVQPDKYLVIVRQGQRDIRRYFTDNTLPDELKWKLGMLMFGANDRHIGWQIGNPADSGYRIKVSEETFLYVGGTQTHDAGVKS